MFHAVIPMIGALAAAAPNALRSDRVYAVAGANDTTVTAIRPPCPALPADASLAGTRIGKPEGVVNDDPEDTA